MGSPASVTITPRRQVADITSAELDRAMRRRGELLAELRILNQSIATMDTVLAAIGISTTEPETTPS